MLLKLPYSWAAVSSGIVFCFIFFTTSYAVCVGIHSTNMICHSCGTLVGSGNHWYSCQNYKWRIAWTTHGFTSIPWLQEFSFPQCPYKAKENTSLLFSIFLPKTNIQTSTTDYFRQTNCLVTSSLNFHCCCFGHRQNKMPLHWLEETARPMNSLSQGSLKTQ